MYPDNAYGWCCFDMMARASHDLHINLLFSPLFVVYCFGLFPSADCYENEYKSKLENWCNTDCSRLFCRATVTVVDGGGLWLLVFIIITYSHADQSRTSLWRTNYYSSSIWLCVHVCVCVVRFISATFTHFTVWHLVNWEKTCQWSVGICVRVCGLIVTTENKYSQLIVFVRYQHIEAKFLWLQVVHLTRFHKAIVSASSPLISDNYTVNFNNGFEPLWFTCCECYYMPNIQARLCTPYPLFYCDNILFEWDERDRREEK